MCYAIPAKIIEVGQNHVTVDYYGEHRKALKDLSDLNVGDYILVQGGVVIKKVPPQEAAETLQAWKELFFALKKQDQLLSSGDQDPKIKLTYPKLSGLLDKIGAGEELSQEELLYLLATRTRAERAMLYKTANHLRNQYLQNSCCIHGIIEFSNYCQQKCQYCGINIATDTERYRLEVDQILELARFAVSDLGFGALVLQSGEDPYYTEEKIVNIIKTIKANFPCLIFLSIGERTKDEYQKYYEAGARGVLLRFETSNPSLYSKLRTGKKLEDRVNLLKALYDQGYLIATGGLIGIPGQTDLDLLNDLKLAHSLKAEMYSFGPFICPPNSPLKDEPNSTGALFPRVLNAIAVARVIDPNAKVLVTTALETLEPETGRIEALKAGANSLMLNITPPNYRKLYNIYPNRANLSAPIEEQITATLKILNDLGRAPTDLGVNHDRIH